MVGATLARGQLARIDELNSIRQENCERLTAQLREIPGVIPPEVPADRSHVYHMYRVRFVPRALGLNVSAAEFRAKVVAALACEGVMLRSWMNWTLPSLPVFTETAEFEARYPWKRPWAANRTYDPRDYPEANRMLEETSGVSEAPTAASKEVIDYIAAGFRKVFAQIDEVLRLKLPPELAYGGLANGDEMERLVREANQ